MIGGGKAAALRRVEAAGFKTPRFIVCEQGTSEDELLSEIGSKLEGAPLFAVRSSAAAEDSTTRSYAGHFYSAIGIAKEDVWNEFLKVVASFGTQPGSVIVQEFIASDRAGVAFSDNGNSLTLINSTFGLCKNVVEGKPCDEFVVDSSGGVVSEYIAPDKPVLSWEQDGMQRSESSERSLSPDMVTRVARLARDAENFFGIPQDIEWCFLGESLFLLQSRPITRHVPLPEEIYFDSANIAESYSGVVLPLTASFARRVYRIVYTEFLRRSGVSASELENHSFVFAGLLAFFKGRMYYNMNNWFRLAQFVPGYGWNKANFERMISSNLQREMAKMISPSPLLNVVYPLIILAKFVVFNRTMARFKADVQQEIRSLRGLDYAALNLSDCQRLIRSLEAKILSRWYVTLENDYLVMTYLGLLQRLYPEGDLHPLLAFKSRATEQVYALSKLSRTLARQPDLWNVVCRGDADEFARRLRDHPDAQREYEQYLEVFGGRFANELKLETVGIDEDTGKFLTIVKNYASFAASDVTHVQYTMPALPLFKRLAFRHFLSRFRKQASEREICRLLRSNMFSIARKLFRRMGAILVEAGALDVIEDVFYLEVEELLGLPDCPDDKVLRQRVANRKRDYEQFRQQDPPTHFVARLGAAEPSKAAAGAEPTARGVSPGVVAGKVKVMREFAMPEQIDFDIIVARNMDPGWTALVALSKGLIIEHGGALSHAAIVARELGIPAVIGVQDATTRFHDGQRIELDGSTGSVSAL